MRTMSTGSRFCHRCGAALPTGAAFCPSCGAAVAVASPPWQATPPAPPSQPTRYEKHEKHEKREKREKQEKGRGGDLAGALTGGLILILLGVLLYFSIVGNTGINYGNFWEYFIIGVGAILILQGVIRYSQRGTPYIGSLIGGAILMIIGLAFVSTANYALWPLILVVLGFAAIASAFTARRRVPVP
jgi:uncharacterized Zn finger protein (UPF0148 family)